jgi:photosystem II stability/assembly factor-like uncharacterized protein
VSGRVAAVAADPHDANTVYIAAAGGGVWKTTDGGTSWGPLTDNQPTLFMGAIAVAPSDPSTIYAGTGEANNSGHSFYGRGVLKSTDGGESWTLLGNAQFNRKTISRIVISPTDSNTVYIAVGSGGVNGVSGSTGIWKSTDGGITWADTTTGITTMAAYSDVAMDPLNPQTLYAAVGAFRGSAANGVYKTNDAGLSWSLLGGGLPSGSNFGNTKIAIAPTDPQTVYVSMAAPFPSGNLFAVLKTVDGGSNWTSLTNVPNYLGTQGWYDTTLAVDPLDASTVYAGGQYSVIRSPDGGATWSDISVDSNGHGPHVDHHGIGFDAAGRLLDGNDGGIWRLDNKAPIRWANLNAGLAITQFIGIALHPGNAAVAFGGSQDNGTEMTTGSSAWTEIANGDGGFVRIDWQNPETIYGETQRSGANGTAGNDFLSRSDNGGLSWTAETGGIDPSDPSNFYIPYIIDPSRPSRLLLGTNRVYESTNRAEHWVAISTPDMDGWVGSSIIDSLAVAPGDGNTIYVAAGSNLFVTNDGGLSWSQRSIPGASHIAAILVDPANREIAYAAHDQFGGGHIFRTTDGGISWSDISGNLPDLPAYTIALGPDTIYLGNDDGVYFSTDLGTSWNRLGDGLPNAQVRELVLNPALGILAAGTHGRGMWELNLGGTATHFLVTSSTNPVTAGSSFQVTVTAVDDQNNPVTGYSGTIHFTSSDSGAALPGDYTFIAADAGVHTFTATLITAGNQQVSVTDSATGISGTGSVTVIAGTPNHLLLTVPDTFVSGVAFDVTVTVLDAFNNTVTSYFGSVQFTSSDSDPRVVLPADYSFTAGDAGVHTFSAGVTLITLGNQTLGVDDPSLGITGAVAVNVIAPAAPPGASRRAPGPSGGVLTPWSRLLQPPAILAHASFSILLSSSSPIAGSTPLSSAVDSIGVTSLFARNHVEDRKVAPLPQSARRSALAQEWAALFPSDDMRRAGTGF